MFSAILFTCPILGNVYIHTTYPCIFIITTISLMKNHLEWWADMLDFIRLFVINKEKISSKYKKDGWSAKATMFVERTRKKKKQRVLEDKSEKPFILWLSSMLFVLLSYSTLDSGSLVWQVAPLCAEPTSLVSLYKAFERNLAKTLVRVRLYSWLNDDRLGFPWLFQGVSCISFEKR